MVYKEMQLGLLRHAEVEPNRERHERDLPIAQHTGAEVIEVKPFAEALCKGRVERRTIEETKAMMPKERPILHSQQRADPSRRQRRGINVDGA